MKSYKVKINGETTDLPFPRYCKYCKAKFNHSVHPVSEGFVEKNSGPIRLHGSYFLVVQCPYCEKLNFFHYYVRRDRSSSGEIFINPSPQRKPKHDDTDFPDLIKQSSPRFAEIYSESAQAEKLGLTELVGMGYRKALEFLLRDYLISKDPQIASKVPKMKLQDVIDHIDSGEIKVLSRVGNKIGNDETHYFKKHDWTVNEMKSYIEAVMVFIMSDLRYQDALDKLAGDHGQSPHKS